MLNFIIFSEAMGLVVNVDEADVEEVNTFSPQLSNVRIIELS